MSSDPSVTVREKCQAKVTVTILYDDINAAKNEMGAARQSLKTRPDVKLVSAIIEPTSEEEHALLVQLADLQNLNQTGGPTE